MEVLSLAGIPLLPIKKIIDPVSYDPVKLSNGLPDNLPGEKEGLTMMSCRSVATISSS
jgi:hypothetical protein